MGVKIMIGCPVRDRAWVLPRYLQCLMELDYPFEQMHFCFIINDCTDNTEEILAAFADNYPNKVHLVVADLKDKKTPSSLRGSYSFSNLAYLRNLLLKQLLTSDCDYLFSVDSDIMVTRSTLKKLLDDNCDIVSALVCNGHELGNTRYFNILRYSALGSWDHIFDFPRNEVFEVDCTGAAILIDRNIIEKHGLRYSAEFGPEDIGFCLKAAEQGVKIYCDSGVELDHIMLGAPRRNVKLGVNFLPTSTIE